MQNSVCKYWRKDVHNEVVRGKVAVYDEEETSFGELFDLSDKIATYLINHINRNGPISVFLPKCKYIVAADMGILQSGHAYNNLDVQSPPERISAIISHINPSAIITDFENKEKMSRVRRGGGRCLLDTR